MYHVSDKGGWDVVHGIGEGVPLVGVTSGNELGHVHVVRAVVGGGRCVTTIFS